MKKFIPILLVLLLILSGCSAEKNEKTSVSLQAKTTVSSSAGTESQQTESTGKTEQKKNSVSEKSGGKSTGITDKSGKKKSTSKTSGTKTGSSKKSEKKVTVKNTTKTKTTSSYTKRSEIRCTLTVDWTAAMKYDDGTKSYLVKNASVKLKSGSTAYDALKQLCSSRGIALDAVDSQYGVYIKGIGGLSEKDRGQYSGWKYMVNGSYPSKSCGKYKLNNGDNIVFIYSVS